VGSTRKIAVVAGGFLIVAAIAAIAGLVLYKPVLKRPGYILGPGADTRVTLGMIAVGHEIPARRPRNFGLAGF
jgi:hypothetical protein